METFERMALELGYRFCHQNGNRGCRLILYHLCSSRGRSFWIGLFFIFSLTSSRNCSIIYAYYSKSNPVDSVFSLTYIRGRIHLWGEVNFKEGILFCMKYLIKFLLTSDFFVYFKSRKTLTFLFFNLALDTYRCPRCASLPTEIIVHSV